MCGLGIEASGHQAWQPLTSPMEPYTHTYLHMHVCIINMHSETCTGQRNESIQFTMYTVTCLV